MPPPMRILATADLHYALRQFDWLGAKAPEFDLIVLAGDLLDLSSAVEPEVQAVVVQKFLRRLALSRLVLTTSGNHDIQDPDEHGERTARWMEELETSALRPDYASHEHSGVLFSVFSWWDGPVSRARAENRLAEDASRPRSRWIWLHHNPPAGTRVAWTGRHDGGDPLLVEWIERHQPDIVFSGHIHNAPYYADGGWHARIGKTWIFNPGKQLGPEPSRIVVDLTANRAEWHSIEGVDAIDLS